MLPYELPEDYDSFWAEATEEAMAAPLSIDRAFVSDFDREGFRVHSFRFRGVDGATRHGWTARPMGYEGADLPGFLWVPPYGRESRLPDAYGTRPGLVSMSLSFHGEGAYHQEKYTVARGYFAEGAEDPYVWIFRRMYMDAVVVGRLLGETTGVDGARLGVMGMSQGAGIALWLGAFSGLFRAVCADMPFFGDPPSLLDAPVLRYPQKELKDFADLVPLGRERLLASAAYFDTAHAASRCRIPTLVSLGQKDPACRPDTVRRVYESLPGEKRLIEYAGGHDWDPGMVQANLVWLLTHLG